MAPIPRPGRQTSPSKEKRKSRKRIGTDDGDSIVPAGSKHAPRRTADPSYRPGKSPSPPSPRSPSLPPSKIAKTRSFRLPKVAPPPTVGLEAQLPPKRTLSLAHRSPSQTPEDILSPVKQGPPLPKPASSAASSFSKTSAGKKVSFNLNDIQLGSRGSRAGRHSSAYHEERDQSSSDVDDVMWDFDLSPFSHYAAEARPSVPAQSHPVARDEYESPVLGIIVGGDAGKYLLSSLPEVLDSPISSASASAGTPYLPTPPVTPVDTALTLAPGKKRRSSRDSLSDGDDNERPRNPTILLTKMLEKPRAVFSLDEIAACLNHIQTRTHNWAREHFSHHVGSEEAFKAWPLYLLKTKYRNLLLVTEHIADSASTGSRRHPGWGRFFTSSESRVALVYGIVGFYALNWVFSSVEPHHSSTTTPPFPWFPYPDPGILSGSSGIKADEVDDYATEAANAILKVIEPLLPPSIFDYNEAYAAANKNTGSRSSSSRMMSTWAVKGDLASIRERDKITRQLSVILRHCVALNRAMTNHLQRAAADEQEGRGPASPAGTTTAIRVADRAQKGAANIRYRPTYARDEFDSLLLKVKMVCWPCIEACIRSEDVEGHQGLDLDDYDDVDMSDVEQDAEEEQRNIRCKALCEQHLYCVWAADDRDYGAAARKRQSLRRAVEDAASDVTTSAWQNRLLHYYNKNGRRYGRYARYGAQYRQYGRAAESMIRRLARKRWSPRNEWKYHGLAMLLGTGWACASAYRRDGGLFLKPTYQNIPRRIGNTVAHYMERLLDSAMLAATENDQGGETVVPKDNGAG